MSINAGATDAGVGCVQLCTDLRICQPYTMPNDVLGRIPEDERLFAPYAMHSICRPILPHHGNVGLSYTTASTQRSVEPFISELVIVSHILVVHQRTKVANDFALGRFALACSHIHPKEETYHRLILAMAIEQIFDLPLHHLQHGISKFGAANITVAVLVTAVLGVVVDYAWMLYLRSKMVSAKYEYPQDTALNARSHQDLFLGLSSVTPSNFRIISL